MLGYITTKEQGASDRLIEKVARRLENRGLRVTGVVQTNQALGPLVRAKMHLELLGSQESVTISQNLGPHATGCRLDPGALELASQTVFDRLDQPTDLLILNKFGKQERDGQGFRDVLVKAIDQGVPILLAVNPTLESAFLAFAQDFAVKLPASLPDIEKWVGQVTGLNGLDL